MPELPVFGKKEFCKALRSFGFDIDETKGKGSHAKAIHPTIKPIHRNQAFIIVKNDKEYFDPKFRSTLVNEIKAYGFTRKQIIKAINKK